MNAFKLISISLVVSFAISGCTMKQEAERKYDKQSDSLLETYDNRQNDSMLSELNKRQVIQKETYVNVDSKKSVNNLLQALSEIDGNWYHLEGVDISAPSIKNYKEIKSFKDLNNFMQSTTNKVLVVENDVVTNEKFKTLSKIIPTSTEYEYIKIDENSGQISVSASPDKMRLIEESLARMNK